MDADERTLDHSQPVDTFSIMPESSSKLWILSFAGIIFFYSRHLKFLYVNLLMHTFSSSSEILILVSQKLEKKWIV
jgi:hypothetical protein